MKNVVRVGVFFALCGLTFGLSGCTESGSAVDDSPSSEVSDFTLSEKHITLQDGRKITCIKYSAGRKGGLSCDWESVAK